MRTKFEVKPCKWAASRKWQVEGPAGKGKCNRKFFKTKAKAQNCADEKNIELLNQGREHAEFDSRLRVMAQDCAAQLRSFGATIEDATKHYIAHRKAVERSCTVEALVDEVLAAEAKACGKRQRPASASYLNDLKLRFGHFTKAFGNRTVATISRLEIDDG